MVRRPCRCRRWGVWRITSAILPLWAQRTKSLDALLPVRYLRGISTGDFQEALLALLGKNAPNLSPAVISRLTGEWQGEYERRQERYLSARRYVYVWADGVFLQARMEDHGECMLVLIGATPEGRKELIGFQVGVKHAELARTARRDEEPRVEGRPGNRRRRWRTRLLEGARRGVSCHAASAVLGAQGREHPEQGRTLGYRQT